MNLAVRIFLHCVLSYILFHFTHVEGKSLVENLTSRGDLDLVLLFDVGFQEGVKKNRLDALNNVVEVARNLLVENEHKVSLTYVTYDSMSVRTLAMGKSGKFTGSASSRRDDSNVNFENFKETVMKTEMVKSVRSSEHLKALNYVGLKHFYNADEMSTKMIIMFMNTDGITKRDMTDLNIVHYLLDRKNITLNIITKVNLKSYCHYIHKVGPNTNELLRCVLKNSYYHNLILTYTLKKFYEDIATNAVCSEWSEWSECTVTCNVGYHFCKRNTLNNVENSRDGMYKRKGKNCSEQRSLIIQECFNTSCDHSLDVCDAEVDLSFLIDDSSNMSQEFWLKYIIQPIRKMISHLNLSKKLVNISITTFSNTTHNWIDFSSNLSRNRDELLIFLEYWRYNLGNTSSKNLKNALKYVHENILNSNSGRPNAHKVLVIFNTGEIQKDYLQDIEDVIHKIKMIYSADVYSICLNNSVDDNCQALSGRSTSNPNPNNTPLFSPSDSQLTTKSSYSTPSGSPPKKQFFYSFTNVSNFRDEIMDILKNICFNASNAIRMSRARRKRNLRKQRGADKTSSLHGQGEEAEAGVGAESEAEPEAEAEVEVEANPEAEAEVETGVEAEAVAEAEVEAEVEAGVEAEPEAESEPEVETGIEAKPEAGVEAEPEAVAEAEPEAESEAEPRVAIGKDEKLKDQHESTERTMKGIKNAENKKKGLKRTNSLDTYKMRKENNHLGSKKNRIILKSVTNLEGKDDEEGEGDEEPQYTSLKKYTSQYNIDALPSYKSGKDKNLTRKLLNFLFKRKKYRFKQLDNDKKKKIKDFINNVKKLDNISEKDYEKENHITSQFYILLDQIFKSASPLSLNGGEGDNEDDGDSEDHDDFDSIIHYSYASIVDDEDDLDMDSTLTHSWNYKDAQQIKKDNMIKNEKQNGQINEDDNNSPTYISTWNQSQKGDLQENHIPNENKKNLLDDIPIDNTLMEDGGFLTSDESKMMRRKRSIVQEEGLIKEQFQNSSNLTYAENGDMTSTSAMHTREEASSSGESKQEVNDKFVETSLGKVESIGHDEKKNKVELVNHNDDGICVNGSAASNKRNCQKRYKSKYDIIQRFKNRDIHVDNKTGISYDEHEYHPSLVEKDGGKKNNQMEESRESKKENSSIHVPNVDFKKNINESNVSCGQQQQDGKTLPASTSASASYKVDEKLSKVEVEDIVGVRTDEQTEQDTKKDNKLLSFIKDEINEKYLNYTNEDMNFHDNFQNTKLGDVVTMNYPEEEEEEEEDLEYNDTNIYKYSASFALATVVVLGLAFLYVRYRNAKNIADIVDTKDFPVIKNEKEEIFREQNVYICPNGTSWQ
ncbi:hypothetical protein, conserved [Plasmodium gonderi]|uniref:VWFA domain-containing protein n=1 Tax=Plasmodium gonderi TaxID=77519 RepID=A0A1Y1JJN0_PLAGO|nr:hypothetical protein, conserved [Plasmodium gonderi]GAW81858.1 hypothetical protein, conserved [Plasmodium gonderi]